MEKATSAGQHALERVILHHHREGTLHLGEEDRRLSPGSRQLDVEVDVDGGGLGGT